MGYVPNECNNHQSWQHYRGSIWCVTLQHVDIRGVDRSQEILGQHLPRLEAAAQSLLHLGHHLRYTDIDDIDT